jgi:zinc finger MIZ domain-containing protein
MAASHRRPRDKGGTDIRDSTAKSFESSNQTMAMFLGGTQKSWMTGHQPTRERPLSSPHTYPHPTSRQQYPASRAKIGESTADEEPGTVDPRHSATIATSGLTPSVHSLGAGTTATTLTSSSEITQENLNTVLPSPAPSDEPRQASVHIIDLEEDVPELPAGQRPGSTVEEALNETRLIELAERYGGIEELEKRLQYGGPRNDLVDSGTHGEVSPALEDAPPLLDASLTHTHEAQSSNSVQQEPLLSSEISHPPVLSAAINVRANILSNMEMQIPATEGFRTHIAHRLESVRSTEHLGSAVEIPRLGLLDEACVATDYFYLIIHQLYCLSTFPNPANRSSLHGLTQDHTDGLVLLSNLLLPNEGMANDAIGWFSIFPLPVDMLLKNCPALKPIHEKVLQCLIKLPRKWPALTSHCYQRYYPPLVDEMISMLGIHSKVLQRVFCRAILREIWAGSQDKCHAEVEKLFHQNQDDVVARESSNDTSQAATGEGIMSYNQHLMMNYQRLWAQHCSHPPRPVQQPPNPVAQQQVRMSNIDRPMAPPQQMSIERFTPRISSVYQNVSQSMYTPPVSRRPASLNIDTQYMSHTPTNLEIPPMIRSSSSSGIHAGPGPAAISPSSANSQTVGVFRVNVSGSQRGRGRPRRDYTVPAASQGHSPRSTMRNRSITHNLQDRTNSVPSQVPANSPLQPLFLRQWEPSSAHVGSPQPYMASPVAAHFGHNVTTSPTAQNISPQLRASLSSQTQNQFRSNAMYSIPSTPNDPHHTQPMFYQSQPQLLPDLGSVPRPPARPLFPPPGHVRSSRDMPNPIPSALHQVRARSPNLTCVNTEGKFDNTATYFTFVRRVAVMPQRLTAGQRYFKWTSEIDKENLQLLAQESDGPDGAPPSRLIRAGLQTCRVRCIKVSHLDEISESDWVIAETVWPNGTAILLNGTALELRKKVHYGKDLPVDITKYIMEGMNEFSVAFTRPNQNDAVNYAVGLERIETIDSKNIYDKVPRLDAADALRRIAEQSASVDPDIEIVTSAVIVDLTDPFTSRIFVLPVRGKTCRHNQCFDLHVFLQTRGSKAGHPCVPEQFRCPICGSDARPHFLLVDLFFVKVREELQRMNRLDVKAILLDDQGSWKIKEEENNGESGDGAKGQTSPGRKHSETPIGGLSVGRESGIIELDDD